MLVLFETSAGYAIFKVLNEGKLSEVADLTKEFETPEKASSLVKLVAFKKFEDISKALSATTALIEGTLDDTLSDFLREFVVKGGLKEKLLLSDSKLATVIKEKYKIHCSYNDKAKEIIRGIRNQMSTLIKEVSEQQMNAMALGLAHSLSRYKLKFSADKVDTMIVQAINLLDELDKEINTYSMRVKEWYGWHYPEMCKIVLDNMQYLRVILTMGTRKNIEKIDFSSIIESSVENELKQTAVTSTGVDLSEEDLENIKLLCNEVIALAEYRSQLYEYLQSRMNAIAPNLSCMVGELVGARLIAHAGSLLNLAKYPASTVQILGAEKALFRALKTKHDTPKYGLIFHASLIGQAPPKIKGKISRVLAAKTALSVRVDALGDTSEPTIGLTGKTCVEDKLRAFDNKNTIKSTQPSTIPFNKNKNTTKLYNTKQDVNLRPEKRTQHPTDDGHKKKHRKE